MKFYTLITIFTLINLNYSFADEANKEFKEIEKVIEQVEILEDAKHGPNNSINYNCQDCMKDTDISSAVEINSDEIKLEKRMFVKGKDDNRIVIKRTKDSPKKFTITFDERHRTCKKYVSFRNPFSGQLGFDCLIPGTNYSEDSITLDLSDRELKGDSEYIEIELVKLSIRNKGHVNARFRDQSGKRISSERGSKVLFFGTKYNLK
ncbi:hypothetical protein [Halobacteriovorax sp. HLS]|uniref:hypothetical protein n=1 Tax=Halobacteriovorax sp. HLS TaxID=2234000 RepID=UPI000FDB4799|nr:hypothetical protein [Halobacteriovorax sp. HLS]